MTLSENLQQFHLMPLVDVRGELERALSDRQKVMGRDDDLALGHADAVDRPAIYDADYSASQISPVHRIDDVRTQADDVRARRFSFASHFEIPLPHKAEGNHDTTMSGARHYFSQSRIFLIVSGFAFQIGNNKQFDTQKETA